MRALIIYDSYFGNTEQIARAIGGSLGPAENIPGEIKPGQLAGAGLLIAGSPTRAFRPTKAITSFLNAIPSNGLRGIRVSAFDTRLSAPDVNSRWFTMFEKVFGYAAGPIAKKLVKKGGDLVISPEGFFVRDVKCPLKNGEVERPADWAKQFIRT